MPGKWSNIPGERDNIPGECANNSVISSNIPPAVAQGPASMPKG